MIQKPVKNNLSIRVIIMVTDYNTLKTDIESMRICDKIKVCVEGKLFFTKGCQVMSAES